MPASPISDSSGYDSGGLGRMLRTNLTSVFNCCKLAVPYMISQKQGKIVNISSVWGVVGASCEDSPTQPPKAVSTP